ncbi:PCC domain-containing protein [Comamonas sp. J-3]|uniref:PCC domain-containing protein n=1 Tax=Comamonas trifloxystrobinivorans TaxID=3350256 RepID=UPI00372B7CB0
MRTIAHPGQPYAARHCIADAQIRMGEDQLPTGVSLLEAFDALCQTQGVQSAVAQFSGGSFLPFAYLMPALSSSPEHAVFYSDRHSSSTPVSFESATITKGVRDGKPWMHCHAIWRNADGSQAGHVIPNETLVQAAPQMKIWYIDGADFEVLPCAETNFSLFNAVRHQDSKTAPENAPAALPAWVVTLRPNQDFCGALLNICQQAGIQQARIRGGVGSLNGVRFTDGTVIDSLATEVFLHSGTIDTSKPLAEAVVIEASMVDYHGRTYSGQLVPGDNPVLVTFELVLEPVA